MAAMGTRDLGMFGEAEDTAALMAEEARAAQPRFRGLLNVTGGLLAAGAAACALVVFGRQGTDVSAPAVDAVSEVVGESAKSQFPYGFDVVENCGVDYRIREVLHNNLGNQGPDDNGEGITFKCSESIDHVFQQNILVEINALSEYHSKVSHLNGKSNDFGKIVVNAGEHVKLKVNLWTMDRKPYTAETFRMTFYDLDEAPHGRAQEYIIAEGNPGYQRDHSTQVNEKDVHKNEMFLATHAGTGRDNPGDSSELTQQQKDRSVVLTYHDTTGFGLELGSKNADHGVRGFEFALHSALSCHKDKVAKTITSTTTTVTTTTVDPAVIAAAAAAKQQAIVMGLGALALFALCGLLAFLLMKKEEVVDFPGTS